MKCIALAIFLAALFYVDMEMTKKFGVDYEGATPMATLTICALFAFAILLIFERGT